MCVELKRLVNNILVSSAITVMLTAECVFNKFLKTGRSDRVGYNSTTLVTLKCNGSRYSNKADTVNFNAPAVNRNATDKIRVKKYAQGRVCLF